MRALQILPGALVSLALHGCGPCTHDGCVGGLRFDARAEDGEQLSGHAYTLTVELEGTRYEVGCAINRTVAIVPNSSCGEPERVAGDGEFTVGARVWFGGDDFEGASAGARELGFRVDAHEDVDEGDLGSMRGPTTARIIIEHEEVVLLDETYELDYERRGGDRCGYCDSLEERIATF